MEIDQLLYDHVALRMIKSFKKGTNDLYRMSDKASFKASVILIIAPSIKKKTKQEPQYSINVHGQKKVTNLSFI